MTGIVFYFQVHQPFRLRNYRFFDIGESDAYFDDPENERILRRVAEKCYLPMNAVLQRLVEQHAGKFRCSFSISGTALDQMELWSPETLDSFRRLAATGCVEFLAETSHHSLSALADPAEFKDQVENHSARIERLFGRRPSCFRNTELILSNDVARMAEELGFAGILGEGADHLLGWRSPHRVYRPEGTERIKLLLRSYKLSDDIAFRFSNRGWGEWPLTAEKFAGWIHGLPEDDRFVGLFMDYETFGEHQWADTGIFDFMAAMPGVILANERFRFETPTEVVASTDASARLDVPHPVSWADAERDLTAWLDNAMQTSSHAEVHALGERVRSAAAAGDAWPLEVWRKLTTSDHFYYMCVKFFSDGDVHKYFSPYGTPHDAYIALANVLSDFRARLDEREAQRTGAIDAHAARPADTVDAVRGSLPAQAKGRPAAASDGSAPRSLPRS